MTRLHRAVADSSRLRIVHVITSLSVGGLEQFAIRLAAAQRESGHRVGILALRGGPLLEQTAALGLETCVLGGGKLRRLLRTTAFSLRYRPHVVHAHNPTALHYAILSKLASGACVVMTDHGQGGRVVRRPSPIERYLTDAVAAVSRGLVERHQLSRFKAPVVVIQNGVPSVGVHASRADIREGLGVSSRFVGVCIASLTAVKAHDVLLDTAARLKARGVPLTLLLAGDGPRRSELEQLAAAMDLDERSVRFLGVRLDVPELLHGADFCVLPSSMEGLPLSILEAMEHGTPVVATAVGGVPEVIENGRSGLLVAAGSAAAMADAIERLHRDVTLRRTLAAEGQEIVRARFGFSAMVGRYQSLYAELLRPGSHGPPYRNLDSVISGT